MTSGLEVHTQPAGQATHSAGASSIESDSPAARYGFFALLVIAVPFLFWAGRHVTFALDEWQHLDGRSFNLRDVFRPHNGHWSIPSVVWFRLCYRVFGLTAYLPYQVPVILAHCTAALVLRQLMVRSGVRGWVASAVALGPLLFGTGRINITWGFQIGLIGSVLCSYVQLWLTSKEEVSRRDELLGVAVGIVGLTTSGVAVATTVGVGMALLIRRGVGAAMLQTAPLALVFGLYSLVFRDEAVDSITPTVGQFLDFFGNVFWQAVLALGWWAPVGAVLALVMVLGLVAPFEFSGEVRKQRLALPVGAATAAVVFAGLTSYTRAAAPFGGGQVDRYSHVLVFLLVPALASGAEALARRGTPLGVVGVAGVLIGLPGNVDKMDDRLIFVPIDNEGIEVLAHSPLLDEWPDDYGLGNFLVPEPTAGFLRDGARRGKISEPESPRIENVLGAEVSLGVAFRPGSADCPRSDANQVMVSLAEGESVQFSSPVSVRAVEGEAMSRGRPSMMGSGRIEAVGGPIELSIGAANAQQKPSVCEG